MDISILIPTYNGESTIKLTLQSLVALDTDGLEWEVLICNNNSTDKTADIIESYKKLLPLRLFSETKQGMSPSLNCLLSEAKGQLITMTNDDVILAPNWAKEFLKLANEKSDCDIFGGFILPYFLVDKPRWFNDFLYKHVAFAMTPEKFTSQKVGPGSIFGPSMAIRRSALVHGTLFDEDIGPNGGDYVMGCESDFLSRLAAHGYECYLSNKITLEHIIRPFQFDLLWIEKRAYRYGLSMYPKDLAKNFEDARSVLGIPLWRINLFLQCWFKKRLGSKNDPVYANYSWEIGFFKGYLRKRFNG